MCVCVWLAPRRLTYLGGSVIIVILGFTVLLVIPFAFTLLLGIWTVLIMYMAPLRDLGDEIDLHKASRDEVRSLAVFRRRQERRREKSSDIIQADLQAGADADADSQNTVAMFGIIHRIVVCHAALRFVASCHR